MNNLKKPSPNRDISLQGFTFLRQFIDPRNYFQAKYKNGGKNWYPKQLIKQLMHYPRFCSINQTQYFAHLTGDPNSALGFTNKPTVNQEYHLINIDVDFCYFSKRLADKAKKLIEKELGQNIFWEPSTSGKDLHGYIIIWKGLRRVQYTNRVMRAFEKVLNAKGKKLGLKAIEIMGLPYEYTYENNIVVDIKGSTPAKLPQSYNLAELINSEICDFQKIEKYIWAHEEIAFAEKTNEGSVGFKYFGFSAITQKIQADVLNKWGVSEKQLGRRKIYSGHLATYLYLLYFLRKHKIQQPSHSIIKFHWNNLFEKGLVDCKYNGQIVTWCRNYLSAEGMVEWTDNRYCIRLMTEDGEIITEGAACSFQLDSRVFRLLGGRMLHTTISIFDLKCNNEHKVPVLSSELRKERILCG